MQPEYFFTRHYWYAEYHNINEVIIFADLKDSPVL